ncbi:endolytic transglycosylase MltG [Pararhodospirillum photometricum]|uniref:Endolytic murein transglycosylase n=1 Tax=Pararhodospirillum photometricum DSM 122 TaxID=1150469 RepID=H6SJ25_PARPM|nr:endolytic transglycosylase MltG [Pararhodospirillum photometricum]CCG07990.1 Aminodeoxychorismate lyase [Pararhodospirillum photometricum DSM 122]
MLRWLRTLVLVVGVLAVLIGGGAYLAREGILAAFDAPGPLAQPRTVMIPAGGGVAGIAATLGEAGVVGEPLLFEAGVRLAGRARDLKAGEYEFPAGATGRAIMDALVSGRVKVYRLTVPEGLTVRAVLALLAETPELSGPLPLPPPEGSLLPETYHFHRGDSREKLLARMRESQQALLSSLWTTRADDLPLATPAEAVVLASVVERETGEPDERARVAGVFVNRLRKGMPLQSDPTVIYGVSEGLGVLDRALTRADLAVAHPWNTYVIPGLPPSPICNPGRAALQATLNPARTQDLYFVADGTGGHRFAETLDAHNQNVRAWRRIQAEP